MHPHIEWIAAVAADPKLSGASVRIACAAAGMAGDRGRYRGRLVALASAAQLSSRHAPDLLKDLADRGFLRLHSGQNGRIDIEIIAPRIEAAPITDKPYRVVAGSIAGISEKRSGRTCELHIYVDAEKEMLKLTISREEAGKIAAVVASSSAMA